MRRKYTPQASSKGLPLLSNCNRFLYPTLDIVSNAGIYVGAVISRRIIRTRYLIERNLSLVQRKSRKWTSPLSCGSTLLIK